MFKNVYQHQLEDNRGKLQYLCSVGKSALFGNVLSKKKNADLIELGLQEVRSHLTAMVYFSKVEFYGGDH
jgi:hypothetical protein